MSNVAGIVQYSILHVRVPAYQLQQLYMVVSGGEGRAGCTCLKNMQCVPILFATLQTETGKLWLEQQTEGGLFWLMTYTKVNSKLYCLYFLHVQIDTAFRGIFFSLCLIQLSKPTQRSDIMTLFLEVSLTGINLMSGSQNYFKVTYNNFQLSIQSARCPYLEFSTVLEPSWGKRALLNVSLYCTISLRFLGIILRFPRLQFSTFVFAFL